MSKAVTITLSMTLKPEAADAFCSGMPDMIKDTKTRPGFKAIRVLRHQDDTNKVILIEDWESVEAYQGYIAWRTERGDMDAMGSILTAPPTLDIWPTVVTSA